MGEMSDYYGGAADTQDAFDGLRRQWISGAVQCEKNRALEERFQQGIWTQRDGSTIAIKDMGDGHLANARAMITRKGFVGEKLAASIRAALGPGPSAEMANEAYQQWADAELDKYDIRDVLAVMQGRISPWLDKLDAEIKRRAKK